MTTRSAEALLKLRQQHLGPSLSLSYKEPLKIIKGEGVFLYDEKGRPYLDCVNNVCHVGHCHPHVVEAVCRQMGQLNTNTRYLHDNIVEYSLRLGATLPAPLEVCFFVCSGSEANDLALRLARTYTGKKDLIVVDNAYHGHTQPLIDASPYKHNGAGGSGTPSHIHVVPMPDGYRGIYPAESANAGTQYANHVREAAGQAVENGGLAGFIAESILGCGGQVIPPKGFMAEGFAHARAAGGVAIADEVQVGFGRVGEHFWGFELHGVTPDIVTMGKPIGNGHPLAAVVTTQEIAQAFNNGMEYFNTFGGNPVSCAAGLAVLDVIEQEELQQNAQEVGGYLSDRLSRLMERHHCIGDVRGAGLFLGIEFVKDRETRTPDAEKASAAVEAMKQRGVLLSTDGPAHNVIKITPPIVFGREHADLLADNLEAVLDALP